MFCFTNLVTDKNEKTKKGHLTLASASPNTSEFLLLILVIVLKHDRKAYSMAKKKKKKMLTS